jgi:hypothetical protein
MSGRKDYYKHGTWNAYCDVCGFKFKADELQDRWDGYKVCQQDWEPRHPRDFQGPTAPERSVPWTRNIDVTIEEI